MYATPADLAAVLGSSHAAIYGSDASAAAAKANEDLAAAAAEIDGHLARRYAVPVTAPSALPLLKDWNLVLAQERAFARAHAQPDFSEKLKRRCDEVRKCLREAAEGTFALAAGLAEPEGASATGMAFVEAAPPLFGRERMRGF